MKKLSELSFADLLALENYLIFKIDISPTALSEYDFKLSKDKVKKEMNKIIDEIDFNN